jgi:hypothetical protein
LRSVRSTETYPFQLAPKRAVAQAVVRRSLLSLSFPLFSLSTPLSKIVDRIDRCRKMHGAELVGVVALWCGEGGRGGSISCLLCVCVVVDDHVRRSTLCSRQARQAQEGKRHCEPCVLLSVPRNEYSAAGERSSPRARQNMSGKKEYTFQHPREKPDRYFLTRRLQNERTLDIPIPPKKKTEKKRRQSRHTTNQRYLRHKT